MEKSIDMDCYCRNILSTVVAESGYKHFRCTLYARYKNIADYIENRYEKLTDRKFPEKCYWLLNGLNDFPKCPVCGNDIKGFINSVKGYSPCCS